ADFDPRQRPWYKQAQDQGKASFTGTYQDAETGETVLSAIAPVRSGEFEGVAGMDISLNAIQKLLASITLGDAGYAVLVNRQGTILFHPDTSLTRSCGRLLLGYVPQLNGTPGRFEREEATWRGAFFRIADARSADGYLGSVVNGDKISQPVVAARTTGIPIAVTGVFVALVVL